MKLLSVEHDRSSVTSKFFHGSFQYIFYLFTGTCILRRNVTIFFFTQRIFKLYLSSDDIDRNLLVQYPVHIQGTCIH